MKVIIGFVVVLLATKRCATPGKAGGFRYGSRPRRLGGRFAAFRSRLKAAFASLKRLEELQLV